MIEQVHSQVLAPSESGFWPRWHPAAGLQRAALIVSVLSLSIGLALHRWQQMGAFVTGNDPGNWLALGRQLWGGQGEVAGGVYPPLVPFLAHGVATVLGPMAGTKLIGVGSLIAVVLAMYFVAAQGMSGWLALAVAMSVGLSSQITETLAFGGYPQNYSFAFLLLAALGFALYLETPSRWRLILGAVCLLGASLAEHVYYAIACLEVVLVWMIWLTTRPTLRSTLHRTLAVAIAAVPSVLASLPTAIMLWRAGYSAPLGASGMGLQDALRHAIVEGRWLWIPVISAGTVFIVLTCSGRRRPLWAVAASLLLISELLFPLSGEIRLVPLVIAGATLAAGLALEALRVRLAASVWAQVPVTVSILFVILLFPLADAQAADLFQYYRVSDRPLLQATAWIQAHHDDHLVVVRKDGEDWPVGWWFEGLTNARIAVGSDESWLAFPRERSNARLADRFFDAGANANDIRALAIESDVRFLVVRRDWRGWQQWANHETPPLRVVFDNGEFMIVDVLAR